MRPCVRCQLYEVLGIYKSKDDVVWKIVQILSPDYDVERHFDCTPNWNLQSTDGAGGKTATYVCNWRGRQNRRDKLYFAMGLARGRSGRQGRQSRGGARGGCCGNRNGRDGDRGGNSNDGDRSRAKPDIANTNERPNSCHFSGKSQWQRVLLQAARSPVTSGGTAELGSYLLRRRCSQTRQWNMYLVILVR